MSNEEQKRLITEIMNDDAKDGIYMIGIEKMRQLHLEAKKQAEHSWIGCDGCDENDKNFWISGFIEGYITEKNK